MTTPTHLLDYTLKVNLFNRFNEKCEMSSKGVAILRKSGMSEQKQFPSTFEFQGDPSVYYIQVEIIVVYFICNNVHVLVHCMI